MYTKYFGFNEKPFTLTPNPRFIFLSKNHKEAFAHLLYGINNHYGFIELVGEVGTGKTTVLRTLLGQLQEENYRSALIFNPCLSGVELLRSINQEFGIDSRSEYANDLLATLNRFLLNENHEGRTVVLVIDEAQNLQPEVLEQVRLISNLETENDKLIQIILAGQPELEALLERPELRQLNQRIAVRYKLRPMSMAETRAYIRHRMEVAGESGGVAFSRYAVKWIYLYTRGVPRMINILCDRSLLIAYGDERRTITSALVSKAIKEILNIGKSRRLSFAMSGAIALVVLAVLGFAASRWLRPAGSLVARTAIAEPSQKNPPSSSKTSLAVLAPASVPAPSPSVASPSSATLEKIRQELSTLDQNALNREVFNAIMQKWGATPLRRLGGRMTMPTMFMRLAAKRNLQVTAFKGTLDEALRFDMPFVVASKQQGELGNICLAVTSAENGLFAVEPKVAGSGVLNKGELAALSSGTYYIVWRNPGQIPAEIEFGEKSFEIHTLQRLLKQAGYYRDEIDGSYNTSTLDAVRKFQRAQQLAGNDKVGELTLAALYKFDTTRTVPTLKRK